MTDLKTPITVQFNTSNAQASCTNFIKKLEATQSAITGLSTHINTEVGKITGSFGRILTISDAVNNSIVSINSISFAALESRLNTLQEKLLSVASAARSVGVSTPVGTSVGTSVGTPSRGAIAWQRTLAEAQMARQALPLQLQRLITGFESPKEFAGRSYSSLQQQGVKLSGGRVNLSTGIVEITPREFVEDKSRTIKQSVFHETAHRALTPVYGTGEDTEKFFSGLGLNPQQRRRYTTAASNLNMQFERQWMAQGRQLPIHEYAAERLSQNIASGNIPPELREIMNILGTGGTEYEDIFARFRRQRISLPTPTPNPTIQEFTRLPPIPAFTTPPMPTLPPALNLSRRAKKAPRVPGGVAGPGVTSDIVEQKLIDWIQNLPSMPFVQSTTPLAALNVPSPMHLRGEGAVEGLRREKIGNIPFRWTYDISKGMYDLTKAQGLSPEDQMREQAKLPRKAQVTVDEEGNITGYDVELGTGARETWTSEMGLKPFNKRYPRSQGWHEEVVTPESKSLTARQRGQGLTRQPFQSKWIDAQGAVRQTLQQWFDPKTGEISKQIVEELDREGKNVVKRNLWTAPRKGMYAKNLVREAWSEQYYDNGQIKRLEQITTDANRQMRERLITTYTREGALKGYTTVPYDEGGRRAGKAVYVAAPAQGTYAPGMMQKFTGEDYYDTQGLQVKRGRFETTDLNRQLRQKITADFNKAGMMSRMLVEEFDELGKLKAPGKSYEIPKDYRAAKLAPGLTGLEIGTQRFGDYTKQTKVWTDATGRVIDELTSKVRHNGEVMAWTRKQWDDASKSFIETGESAETAQNRLSFGRHAGYMAAGTLLYLTMGQLMYGTVASAQQAVEVTRQREVAQARTAFVMGGDKTTADYMLPVATGMGTKYGISPTAIAQSWTPAAATTKNIVEQYQLMDSASKLAIVSGMDLIDVQQRLVAIVRQNNIHFSDLPRILDLIANTTSKVNVSMEELVEIMAEGSAIKEQFGISSEEFIALSASAMEISSAQSDQVRAMMNQLASRMYRPEQAEKIYRESGVGVFVKGSGGEERRPIIDVLKELAEASKTMTDSQKFAVAEAATGVRGSYAQILRRLLEDWDTVMAKMANIQDTSLGQFDRAFGNLADTFDVHAKRMSASWENFLTTLGNTDALKATADALAGTLDTMSRGITSGGDLLSDKERMSKVDQWQLNMGIAGIASSAALGAFTGRALGHWGILGGGLLGAGLGIAGVGATGGFNPETADYGKLAAGATGVLASTGIGALSGSRLGFWGALGGGLLGLGTGLWGLGAMSPETKDDRTRKAIEIATQLSDINVKMQTREAYAEFRKTPMGQYATDISFPSDIEAQEQATKLQSQFVEVLKEGIKLTPTQLVGLQTEVQKTFSAIMAGPQVRAAEKKAKSEGEMIPRQPQYIDIAEIGMDRLLQGIAVSELMHAYEKATFGTPLPERNIPLVPYDSRTGTMSQAQEIRDMGMLARILGDQSKTIQRPNWMDFSSIGISNLPMILSLSEKIAKTNEATFGVRYAGTERAIAYDTQGNQIVLDVRSLDAFNQAIQMVTQSIQAMHIEFQQVPRKILDDSGLLKEFAQAFQSIMDKLNPQEASRWKDYRSMVWDETGRAQVFSGFSPDALSNAQSMLSKFTNETSITSVKGLTPSKMSQLLPKAQEWMDKLEQVMPGYKAAHAEDFFTIIDKYNQLLGVTSISMEAFNLAMQELTDATKDQIRGYYNLPAGYEAPTVPEFYAKNPNAQRGPYNYPWLGGQSPYGFLTAQQLVEFIDKLKQTALANIKEILPKVPTNEMKGISDLTASAKVYSDSTTKFAAAVDKAVDMFANFPGPQALNIIKDNVSTGTGLGLPVGTETAYDANISPIKSLDLLGEDEFYRKQAEEYFAPSGGKPDAIGDQGRLDILNADIRARTDKYFGYLKEYNPFGDLGNIGIEIGKKIIEFLFPSPGKAEATELDINDYLMNDYFSKTDDSLNPHASFVAPIAGMGFVAPIAGMENVSPHWDDPRVRGGVDIFAPEGTPVRAMKAGTVSYAGYDPIGGYNAMLKDINGLEYYYAHMAENMLIKQGQQVNAGDVLGYVSNTGNAVGTDPHLHLGVGQDIISGTGPFGGTGTNFDLVGALNGATDTPQISNGLQAIYTRLAETNPVPHLSIMIDRLGSIIGRLDEIKVNIGNLVIPATNTSGIGGTASAQGSATL